MYRPIKLHYVRKPTHVRRHLLMVGGVALLAGCDAHKLTEPRTSGPPAHRTILSEPIGYTFLTPPPNSSPEAVASITSQTVGSIPDSTWVVIMVDGEITQTWNPDCAYAPPNWPCLTGPISYPFGPTPTTSGPVGMWVEGSNGWSPAKLRGVGGSNSNSAIGLHFQGTAGGMAAKLNLMAQWAWNPNSGTGPYTYSLSGGYNVNATLIASPIVVRDQGPLDAAGTHRYSVQTVHGLQFINPTDWSWTWPAGATHWYFFTGSSVSETPGFLGHHYELAHCRFQMTCDYAPPGPGRVQATAYVETRYVMARTRDGAECDGLGGPGEPDPLGFPNQDVITCTPVVSQPTLQVTCATPIRRGERSNCTASVSPTTPDFVVLEWKYAGTSYSTQIDTTADVKEWELLPPVTGKVTVRAMVDGSEQIAEAHILVNDCDFFRDPQSDPRLLSPVLQAGLIDIARQTGWNGPLSQRLEHGGYVVQTPQGGERWVRAEGPQNLCAMQFDLAQMAALNQNGYRILGQPHTHPTGGGQFLNPGNCLRYNPTTQKFEFAQGTYIQFLVGPSLPDLGPWTGPNPRPWPGYVLEPRRLWAWEVDAQGTFVKQSHRLKTGPTACIQ